MTTWAIEISSGFCSNLSIFGVFALHAPSTSEVPIVLLNQPNDTVETEMYHEQ